MQLPVVPADVIAARAGEVDTEARFPVEALEALRDAGLWGLLVPGDCGGLGASLSDAAAVVEQVAAACGSSGMVFTMHLAATQTLVGGRGPSTLIDGALAEIANGTCLATLAYSENGSRSHFWSPVSRVVPGSEDLRVDANKSWVTSAGHADRYVVSVGVDSPDDPLASDLYIIAGDAPGFEVSGAFDGLGLRGNASAPMTLRDVELAEDQRLGEAGGGFGLMLSATLPVFVVCSAACAVGLAGAAVDAVTAHASSARLEHLGASLADLPVVRARIAAAKVRHMQARALLYEVAAQLDAGAPEAQLGVLAVKASAAEMALEVTSEAMRVGGGAAFSRQLPLERLFRDARAASVMAPTTDLLYEFIGKAVTGQEVFA